MELSFAPSFLSWLRFYTTDGTADTTAVLLLWKADILLSYMCGAWPKQDKDQHIITACQICAQIAQTRAIYTMPGLN